MLHYFSNNGWFWTVQAGYNYKYAPVPSAINSSLKVGKATSHYYFDVWYDHQASFGGLDYRGTPAPSSFRELGVAYHKLGATYYKPLFEHLGGFIGMSYVLSGRNIGQGLAGNIGLVLKSK